MRREVISCLMVGFLCATSGTAQYGGKITDIRKVDFLNFTYPSSLCSQEFGKKGIGKSVRVRKGEFKNRSVYFAVEDGKVLYGDVTGDGHEDAIVPVGCGAIGANFSRSEIYVYTIKDGRTTLLAQISDKDMEGDYRRHYPDAESYWGATGSGLKVANGNLEIEVLADGPHASPKYIVTLDYGSSGESFGLVGKPQRRSSSQGN